MNDVYAAARFILDWRAYDKAYPLGAVAPEVFYRVFREEHADVTLLQAFRAASFLREAARGAA